MRKVNVLDRMIDLDRIDHLHCRKRQTLAYLTSQTPWYDLLAYRALESTADIYHHCYQRRMDRWSYDSRYAGDDDLRLLGFEPRRNPKATLADLIDELPDHLGQHRPVMFYAPRCDLPHMLAFMRRNGTVPAEYDLPHSFMVTGLSEDRSELLLLDTTTGGLRFGETAVDVDILRSGFARHPDRWFLDCLTVVRMAPEPDFAAFTSQYQRYVQQQADGFEIYDLIAERFAGERENVPETYRAPSVNALALLAGSRDLFARFLVATTHTAEVTRFFDQTARLLVELLAAVGDHHGGQASVSPDALRRDLHLARHRERRGFEMLVEELQRGGGRICCPASPPDRARPLPWIR